MKLRQALLLLAAVVPLAGCFWFPTEPPEPGVLTVQASWQGSCEGDETSGCFGTLNVTVTNDQSGRPTSAAPTITFTPTEFFGASITIEGCTAELPADTGSCANAYLTTGGRGTFTVNVSAGDHTGSTTFETF
jgi:hypothetical protein